MPQETGLDQGKRQTVHVWGLQIGKCVRSLSGLKLVWVVDIGEM